MGESIESASKKVFTKQVLKVDGRFGSYGAPTDIKVTADEANGPRRSIDFGFATTPPGRGWRRCGVEGNTHGLAAAGQHRRACAR